MHENCDLKVGEALAIEAGGGVVLVRVLAAGPDVLLAVTGPEGVRVGRFDAERVQTLESVLGPAPVLRIE